LRNVWGKREEELAESWCGSLTRGQLIRPERLRKDSIKTDHTDVFREEYGLSGSEPRHAARRSEQGYKPKTFRKFGEIFTF
jgi:hypothetical protein